MPAKTTVKTCPGCHGNGDAIDLCNPPGPRLACKACAGWGLVVRHWGGPFPVTEKQEFEAVAKWVAAMIGEVA